MGPPVLRPQRGLELAFRVLEEHRLTQAHVGEALHQALVRWNWPAAQRGWLTELTLGVTRRRATLFAVIQAALSRPLASLEPELQTVLLLGAYQLVFAESVPSYAAVDETVELTKQLGQMRWTKFVNGVLRGITRQATETIDETPSSNGIGLSATRYRRWQTALFAEPERDLALYVAGAFSLPEWLTRRWASRFEAGQLLAIAAATVTPPELYLRVNRRLTSPAELQQAWQAAGILSETVAGHPAALRLLSAIAVPQLPRFDEGICSPQDLTAMTAAERLAPCPGDRVWDVCAAPGTKTTHLAELMDDHGEIVATDVSGPRLQRVEANARRLGLTSIRTQPIDEDGLQLPEGQFDAILLDAPCSNTGVLQRRPEARWRLTPEDLSELPVLQQRLLRQGLSRLRPGGRLLYSTCSIEPEENSAVVAAVCATRPEISLVEEVTLLPGSLGDGGYQALLVRRS